MRITDNEINQLIYELRQKNGLTHVIVDGEKVCTPEPLFWKCIDAIKQLQSDLNETNSREAKTNVD